MTREIGRRDALVQLGALVSAGVLAKPLGAGLPAAPRAGKIKQSVSRWCYGRIKLDDLCEAAKAIGYKSVELLDEADWATPKKHGLECALANGFGTIPVGFNRPDNHDKLVAAAERMIPLAAAAGVLLPQIVSCHSAQLIIDNRHQPIESTLIPIAPIRQQTRNLL